MALSDLAVYSEYAYQAMTEVLQQQTQLFNAASGGTIVLTSAAHQGDFSQTAFFAKIAGGSVRRRNAYGSGTLGHKSLAHKEDVSVKVAAGTHPIDIFPSDLKWIQQDPATAGAAMGQQVAVDAMADMLNTGIGVSVAALSQIAELNYDATANAAPNDGPTWSNLLQGQAKFGDQSSRIAAWIMHSVPMHKLYGNNLTNGERLFTYGTINVIRDPFGKLLVMTDSDNLANAGATPTYNILGLVPGAIQIGQNNDFFPIEEPHADAENAYITYKSEWSFNVGVQGFAWDKATGGKSPNDAALLTATNWDRYATSHKDMAGVLVKVK